MLKANDLPLFEFDDSVVAKINPEDMAKEHFSSNKMVITFFPEAIEKLKSRGLIEIERRIGGENPFDVYRFMDSDVLLVLGQVGCPACAGNLDMFFGMGINKVMFCGGGGVLDKNIQVGELLLVEGAIRDEGFSYHYLKPSRYVYAKKEIVEKISHCLDSKKISYMKGLVWTTDAIFRETKDKIELRKKEGAKIVEMEQAGCLAVAEFRDFDYGAIMYGGNDCSGERWDKRNWRSREGIRYDLVLLCKELVQEI